jgi:hypothetical protein
MQLCITTRGEVAMKRRSLLLALCSSAFISAPALADEVKQEAEKLAVAYTDCVAKKDAACVAALYTKDGVQINPGGVFSDLKTVYENNFKNGTDHIEIRVGNMSSSTTIWSLPTARPTSSVRTLRAATPPRLQCSGAPSTYVKAAL